MPTRLIELHRESGGRVWVNPAAVATVSGLDPQPGVATCSRIRMIDGLTVDVCENAETVALWVTTS